MTRPDQLALDFNAPAVQKPSQHRWTQAENALFSDASVSLGDIAKYAGVSLSAAQVHAVTLRAAGYDVADRRVLGHRWTDSEIALMFDPTYSVADIAVIAGVSVESVRQKMVKLRKKKGLQFPERTHAHLIGERFGRLTVEAAAGARGEPGRQRQYWTCLCECGNKVDVPTAALRNGNTRSCGCLHLETVVVTGTKRFIHGLIHTPTYTTWVQMRQRCREHHNYAGRGISVDPRWESFVNFVTDMGVRPDGRTLDRIDVDGPYSPSNCRWATPTEQANNRRISRRILFKDQIKTIGEWAHEYGIPYDRLHDRLRRGWDVERALTHPPRGSRRVTAILQTEEAV